MASSSNTKRKSKKSASKTRKAKMQVCAKCKTIKEANGLAAVRAAEDFLFEGRPDSDREEWDSRWTAAEKREAHFVHYLKKKRTKWYEGIKLTIGSGEKASVVGELRPATV